MAARVPWEPNYGVFQRDGGDHPVSVVTDIHARPVASHPVRILVRIALEKPRPDGLRDESELVAFGAAEDAIVEALTARLDAIYLGRFTRAGHATFVFQVPAAQADAANRLDEVLPDVAPYAPGWGVDDDPEWVCWQDTLAPDPYELQAILNEQLLDVFSREGDALEVPREVDHVAFFSTREQADAAAADLRSHGFTTDDPRPPEGESPWALTFHRRDALADGQADAFSWEVLDIVLEHDGAYDGWGAPHANRG